jgi:hypothetical protein
MRALNASLTDGEDWPKYYAVEPSNFTGGEAADAKGLVGGVEVCMWSEFVDASNFISREWARAASVGERGWSNKAVRDVSDARFRLHEFRCKLLARGIGAEPITNGGSNSELDNHNCTQPHLDPESVCIDTHHMRTRAWSFLCGNPFAVSSALWLLLVDRGASCACRCDSLRAGVGPSVQKALDGLMMAMLLLGYRDLFVHKPCFLNTRVCGDDDDQAPSTPLATLHLAGSSQTSDHAKTPRACQCAISP